MKDAANTLKSALKGWQHCLEFQILLFLSIIFLLIASFTKRSEVGETIAVKFQKKKIVIMLM